jgi:hypothetical protein
MTPIGRFAGLVLDANPGGTNFDTLVAGAVPAPTIFWPLTGFEVDKGETALSHDDLIQLERGEYPEASFKQAPSVTLRGRLFTGLGKKLWQLAQGKADARTGAAPVASAHVLDAIGMGSALLPAVHLHLYRDGLYERVAGCQLDTFNVSIPNDGDATFEAVFRGLYRFPDGGTYPTPAAFDDVTNDWVFNPRDSKVFVDGSVTAITGMRGFTIAIDNKLRDPDFDWGANVESLTVGGKEFRIWWPARRRLSTSRTVTGQIQFQDVKVAQDRAHDLRQAQKLEVLSEGPALTTTPAARELLKHTLYLVQYTGGGAGAASRDGDIQTEFDYSAKIDKANGNRQLRVEIVDQQYTAITAS